MIEQSTTRKPRDAVDAQAVVDDGERVATPSCTFPMG